jgi:Transposase
VSGEPGNGDACRAPAILARAQRRDVRPNIGASRRSDSGLPAVVMVPPEQSADLRDYYSKHVKSDRLDSRLLARLPLLHPEGLRPAEGLGPAGPLRRAVALRGSLVKRRSVIAARLDSYLELPGPGWHAAFGGT